MAGIDHLVVVQSFVQLDGADRSCFSFEFCSTSAGACLSAFEKSGFVPVEPL